MHEIEGMVMNKSHKPIFLKINLTVCTVVLKTTHRPLMDTLSPKAALSELLPLLCCLLIAWIRCILPIRSSDRSADWKRRQPHKLIIPVFNPALGFCQTRACSKNESNILTPSYSSVCFRIRPLRPSEITSWRLSTAPPMVKPLILQNNLRAKTSIQTVVFPCQLILCEHFLQTFY